MFLFCIYAVSFLALAYFLYYKVILVYYLYFYYTRQGVPSVGVPLPVIGTLHLLKKAMDRQKEFRWTPLEEYWSQPFGKDTLPPIILAFHTIESVLVINDPEIAYELYVTYNKYFDKAPKMNRVSAFIVGESSILTSGSDEVWSTKRKHLSNALYRDKITPMLNIVIGIAYRKLQEIKAQNVANKTQVDITRLVSDLIMDCIVECVFGIKSDEMEKLDYEGRDG